MARNDDELRHERSPDDLMREIKALTAYRPLVTVDLRKSLRAALAELDAEVAHLESPPAPRPMPARALAFGAQDIGLRWRV